MQELTVEKTSDATSDTTAPPPSAASGAMIELVSKSPEGPPPSRPGPDPRITTAHYYVRGLQKRWFGGRQYGKNMSGLLADVPFPADATNEDKINQSLAMLEEAKRKAPNASRKTQRRWIKQVGARLASLGVVPE